MMIPAYFITFFKIVLVAIILLGMIVILLGINHVTHNDDFITEDETQKLKQDLKSEERVITQRSVFHNFLARGRRQRITNRD